MSVNTKWEDVLGNDGGTALSALGQLGLSADSSVGKVAEAIQKFCKEVYSDPSDWMTMEQAEEVARDLLRDAAK